MFWLKFSSSIHLIITILGWVLWGVRWLRRNDLLRVGLVQVQISRIADNHIELPSPSALQFSLKQPSTGPTWNRLTLNEPGATSRQTISCTRCSNWRFASGLLPSASLVKW